MPEQQKIAYFEIKWTDTDDRQRTAQAQSINGVETVEKMEAWAKGRKMFGPKQKSIDGVTAIYKTDELVNVPSGVTPLPSTVVPAASE